MTRQQAEENYRKKFCDTGLDERFEYVKRDWESDHGRKVFVKCKVCGAQFSTYGVNEVFRGRQKHLLCIECGAASDGEDVKARSPLVDKAIAYYTEGHSVSETADKFNFTKVDINNFVKARGVSNGRDFCEEGKKPDYCFMKKR